jgi:hypothetical protein
MVGFRTRQSLRHGGPKPNGTLPAFSAGGRGGHSPYWAGRCAAAGGGRRAGGRSASAGMAALTARRSRPPVTLIPLEPQRSVGYKVRPFPAYESITSPLAFSRTSFLTASRNAPRARQPGSRSSSTGDRDRKESHPSRFCATASKRALHSCSRIPPRIAVRRKGVRRATSSDRMSICHQPRVCKNGMEDP